MIARRPVCLFGLFMIFLLPVSVKLLGRSGLDSAALHSRRYAAGHKWPRKILVECFIYDITVEPDYGRAVRHLHYDGQCMLKDMPATEARVDLQTPMELSAVTVDYAPGHIPPRRQYLLFHHISRCNQGPATQHSV